MRILGIDPGYDRCGFAILERTHREETLVHSQCVETDRKSTLPERLAHIQNELEHLVQTYKPDAAALERLYFSNNQKTALAVAEARGMLLACIAAHHIPIAEYTPNQVKLAITGHGGADKKQMVQMLHRLLPINKKIAHDDEYDAIGVALTHSAHCR